MTIQMAKSLPQTWADDTDPFTAQAIEYYCIPEIIGFKIYFFDDAVANHCTRLLFKLEYLGTYAKAQVDVPDDVLYKTSLNKVYVYEEIAHSLTNTVRTHYQLDDEQYEAFFSYAYDYIYTTGEANVTKHEQNKAAIASAPVIGYTSEYGFMLNDGPSNTDFEMASHKLPGIKQKMPECPDLKCGVKESDWTLRGMIMHLNDSHKWTREKIADWLDELHDAGKINIEFEPWEANDE